MKFRLILNFVVVIVLVVLTAEYGGRNLGIIETLEKHPLIGAFRRRRKMRGNIRTLLLLILTATACAL